MKNALTIGGAMLALATLTTAADARMMGGMSMPSSMSRGDIRTPVTSSLGSPRTFSPDGHSFSGRTFSPDGLQQKVKGSNWKKPIDADGGGPADPTPPKKSGNGSTQTSSNGTDSTIGTPPGPYWPRNSGGYYGGWNPHLHHGGYYCQGKPGC
jgi:hypothetical protein